MNIDDFALLAANFNRAGTWAQGNFDGDVNVGIGDFALLAANFNLSIPSDLPRAGGVPEPACVALLVGLGLARRRRLPAIL